MTEVCVVCVPGRVVETMDVRPEGRHYLTSIIPAMYTTWYYLPSSPHTRVGTPRHATPRCLTSTLSVCLFPYLYNTTTWSGLMTREREREREVREMTEVREEREQEKESFHVDSIL